MTGSDEQTRKSATGMSTEEKRKKAVQLIRLLDELFGED